MADESGGGSGVIVIDYDQLTVLARRIWTLRDKLDGTVQGRSFPAGDVSPRRETAEALTDFYAAAEDAFKRGWNVMTELGNTFDEIGKAFFDHDGSIAAGVTAQIADQKSQKIAAENDRRARAQKAAEDKFLADYMERTGKVSLTEEEKKQLLSSKRFLTEHPSPTPVAPPDGFTDKDKDGSTTEFEYKRDLNGEVIETTTTITNANGLVYSETVHPLSDDGDSVTTIRSSNGTVTKVYLDVSPQGYPEGYMIRYVTDENGVIQQVWRKAPDGDWTSGNAGTEIPERPPAYLTVENPLVGKDGHPTGDVPYKETTTTLPDGIVRTEYERPDGSVLKIVTVESSGIRMVADESNVIQEVWIKLPGWSEWSLKDSVTVHDQSGEPPLGTLDPNALR